MAWPAVRSSCPAPSVFFRHPSSSHDLQVEFVEIVNESRMGRVPTKQFLGQRTRRGVVERDEEGEEVEVVGHLLRRDADSRNVQVAADDLGDLSESGEGWIVNITSIAGVRQTGSSLPYAVSKAAVDHLTTLLAKFAGGQVRVNAVAPGLVDTPWTEGWDAQRELVAAAAPLHRTATPEDVADACIGIVGSLYLTGQTVVVDGGLSLMI